jgi:hypothetical protein
MNHATPNAIPEIEARYQVVTLLYLGKVHEAELALDSYVNDGTISRKNEAFYRFLLEGAHRYANDLDTSFHDIPTPDQPKNELIREEAYRL